MSAVATAVRTVGLADLRGALERRWLTTATTLGLAGVVAGGAVGAARTGSGRLETLHTWQVNIFLIGGLVVALLLGATAANRDAESGFFGLAHVAGLSREAIGAARVASRLATLLAVLGVWLAAVEVASLALGGGLDGPAAVHALATAESMALVLLAAAACSTVLGPASSTIVGLLVYVVAQAMVNLEAALDANLIGTSWETLVRVLHGVLPRTIASPLLASLGNRGEGGPAAARFEINHGAVPIVVADPTSVAMTLLWCAILAALAVHGLRRRAL